MSPAGLTADREARRLAQTEFDRPVVLEAGAGTGKTTTLVARILSWCLGPGWERVVEEGSPEEPDDERIAARVLGGLVAITFTEAAAAEMASRIGEELGGIVRTGELPSWLDPPPVAAPLFAGGVWPRRAAALLATLDHLTVSTIHAWCLGLLAEHPLEAELHPRLTVDADGRRVEETARQTVEARLGSAYGESPDESFLALAARGIGPAEIVETLTVLAGEGLPPEALGAEPLGAEPAEALRRRLEDACRRLRNLVAPRLAAAEGRLDKAREVSDALEELLSASVPAGDPPDLPGLLAAARRAREGARGRLREWARGRLTGTEGRVLGEVRDELATLAGEAVALLDHLESLDPELLALGCRVLAPLLATVRSELRARGVLTFQDLLTQTARLLGRRPEVAARVRRRTSQLLVDELQDTDRLQCEILRRIALQGPERERPGLFLVGDPKQSIYGWRNADLAAYEELVEEVVAAGGVRRPLVQSFRSVPAVLEEVTRVVAPVMRETPRLQPPYEPLLPCDRLAGQEGFRAGGRRPVEHWLSWCREEGDAPGRHHTRSADADTVEARAIARDLAELHHHHGVPWEEMALLFRSTTAEETYLDALRRAGVPFQVRGDKQYYRRREIIEAAALVRAVIDPGDHLALVTLLRSSMVGVPDAAWIPLWRHGLPRRATELGMPELTIEGPAGGREDGAQPIPRRGRAAFEHRPQRPPDGPPQPHPLARIVEIVRAAAAEVPADVPGLDRLGGWEVSLIAALEHLARARRSFAEDPADVFVTTLRDLFLPEPVEAARYLGVYRLANLERFFGDLVVSLEEARGDVGAVLRLLRRSVAEALEAPEGLPQHGAEEAVRVMTLHGAKGLEFDHVYLPQLHRRTDPPGNPPTEVIRRGEAWEVRLFGAPSLGFDLVAAERRAVTAAERVRLLYVAATRARQRLVMLGSWPPRAAAKEPEEARSLLDLVLSRRPPPPAGGPGAAGAGSRAAGREGDLEALWEELEARGAGRVEDAQGVLWRLPALEPAEGAPAAGETAAPALPSPEEVARGAEVLARRRRQAAARQGRPFTAAASEEAHDRLRELLADPGHAGAAQTGAAQTGGPAPPDRAVPLAVGTAVHGLLEHLGRRVQDPAADPTAELARLGRHLAADLARRLPEEALPEARELARGLLDRLSSGPLLGRLVEIGPGILARELPVLLPAPEDGGEGAPVGYVAGAVDLLYRDPADGSLVIADYKTDAVETDAEIAARAAAYAPQGEIYRRAVQEALALPAPPRFELWFLHAGRVVEG